jgi:hypothetical protein
MAFTLFENSQRELDQVLETYRRWKTKPEHDPETYADFGRMIMAMCSHHVHPARIFQLIVQMNDAEDPKVDHLTILAWISAEDFNHKQLPTTDA